MRITVLERSAKKLFLKLYMVYQFSLFRLNISDFGLSLWGNISRVTRFIHEKLIYLSARSFFFYSANSME